MSNLGFIGVSKDYTDGKKKIYHEVTDGGVVTTYIGMAQDGKVPATSSPSWRIVRIVETTSSPNVTTEFFYPSTGDRYDQVWDDRTTLTYI